MNTTLINALKAQHDEMKTWQEFMHQSPELSMQEEHTSKFIVEQLKSFEAYEIVENVGKHGIVASLKVGNSDRSIGIRADFDALPIQEDNDLSYKSSIHGVGHLCGHDGHTAMALGAAKYLAATKNFNGTVRFIFQPGEETMEGAPAMIADGLFDRFPMDEIYALHNMPTYEFGKFVFREGETMAAVDSWEIEIEGKGSHGAIPELGVDPIVCASSLVMALQTIVSRNVSPWKQCVVNVGAFHAGTAGNIIPQKAHLKLSIRNMDSENRHMVLKRIKSITKAQAETYGCNYTIKEGIVGSVLVNSTEQTRKAYEIAKNTFGENKACHNGQAFMGSEDFAFMLEHKPGNYVMLGNGDGPMLHHPQYQFNQDLLPIGAAYWVALAEGLLK